MIDCRCNVQRVRHAGNKNGQFVMLDAASGDTLTACHNAKSHAYDVFLHTAHEGEATSVGVAKLPAPSTMHMPHACSALLGHSSVKHKNHRKTR